MKRVKEGLLVAAAAYVITPLALADHRDNSDYEADYRGQYDYADVLDAEPIYKTVEVSTPRQVCWDEIDYENENYRRRGRGRVAGSAVVGGIIGGVIGHQIGSGGGNEIATVAGAVIGSAIGASRAARKNERRQYEPRIVQRCETRYEYDQEEVLDGYLVTYEYNGRQYETRTADFPGSSIRVRVSVTPVDRY